MGDDFAPAEPTDGYAMTMTATVLDHGGADLPLLVAETVGKAYVVNDGSGELTNVVASHLLARGFHLVTRLRQAPPQVAEWIGVLLLGHGPAGEDGLLVLDPDGGKFYTGPSTCPTAPPGRPLRLGRAVRRQRRRARSPRPRHQDHRQGTAHRHPGRAAGRRPHRRRHPGARPEVAPARPSARAPRPPRSRRTVLSGPGGGIAEVSPEAASS